MCEVLKLSTREQQKQKRRAEILTAAKKLFLSRGLQEVQLQEIADEAGIGIATFYRYFPKKEQLVVAVNNLLIEDMTVTLEEIVSQDISAFEQFEKVLEFFIEIADEPEHQYVRFVKAVDIYIQTNPEIPEYEDYRKLRLEYAKVLLKIAEKGKVDGSIRQDVDVAFAIFTLIQNMSYFATESLVAVHDPQLPIELNGRKQVKLLKDIFLNYMKPLN